MTNAWKYPPKASSENTLLNSKWFLGLIFAAMFALATLAAVQVAGKAIPQAACDKAHFPQPCHPARR